VRNVGLVAVAASSWVSAGSDPVLRFPAGGERVPAFLAAAALAAAAITGWRASAWFRKGSA
jgi:hypothetical protein